MRECGLKPGTFEMVSPTYPVTPHAGVWIETSRSCPLAIEDPVTPHAGVWIETYTGLQ